MKTKLIATLTRDEMLKIKEQMIAEEKQKKQLVKWSDNHIETRTKMYHFIVIPVTFPLSNLSGYDEVEADSIVHRLEKITQMVKNEVRYKEPKNIIPPKYNNTPPQTNGSNESDPNATNDAENEDKTE